MESDASKCEVCGEIIIKKMFQLVIFVGYDPQETKHKLCASCYAELNEKEV
jgi:hypothetical protein